MRTAFALLLGSLLLGCDRPTPIFVPLDTREERGPFPVGFVGTLSGPRAEFGLRALGVLQRDLEDSLARGRRIEWHVLDDAGDAHACAQGIQRFARDFQAPLVLVASAAGPIPAPENIAVLQLEPGSDPAAAARRARTALETTPRWTAKDLRAALVGSAP
jgi:hypothetical protein